mmetsp:Transcript_96833/g.273671  ORF Transcript_96833/g.273671 Transcript_96833/m.273671 type:complete len:517 (-) Transcript_96833:58-1608(-)
MWEPKVWLPTDADCCWEGPALYCTPHVKVPGELFVAAAVVRFQANEGPELMWEFGSENYEVSIEIPDILECCTVVLPVENEHEHPGNSDRDEVASFLQLHLRTLDGAAFCEPEDVQHAWCLVFQMPERQQLYQAAHLLRGCMSWNGAFASARRQMPSRTSVPFPSLDCATILEAEARLRLQRSRSADQQSKGAGWTLPSFKQFSRQAARHRAVFSVATPKSRSGEPDAPSPSAAAEAAASPSCRLPARRRSRRQTDASSPQAQASSAPLSPSRSCDKLHRRGPALRATLRPGEVARPLLTQCLAERIYDHLPVCLRVPGVIEWALCYTPKVHGVSLATLFRNVAGRGMTLLLIQDSEEHVFGGFAPVPWEPRGRFYGSGEAFVFSCGRLHAADGRGDGGFGRVAPAPAVNSNDSEAVGSQDVEGRPTTTQSDESLDALQPSIYPWTLKNNYFMYSDSDLIAMGGGDGHHSIAIFEDLLKGHSSWTPTFGNPTLASAPDFVVRDLEIWAFEDPDDAD